MTEHEQEVARDLLEEAWGLLANANGNAPEEMWTDAFVEYRTKYLTFLGARARAAWPRSVDDECAELHDRGEPYAGVPAIPTLDLPGLARNLAALSDRVSELTCHVGVVGQSIAEVSSRVNNHGLDTKFLHERLEKIEKRNGMPETRPGGANVGDEQRLNLLSSRSLRQNQEIISLTKDFAEAQMEIEILQGYYESLTLGEVDDGDVEQSGEEEGGA